MGRPREALLDFARRYRADADVRARVARGDTSDLDRTAADIPDEVDLRIVEQTAETFYLPLPPAPNESLRDESLVAVSGGSCGNAPHLLQGDAWDPWWHQLHNV